jgi:hypothetical protein
MYELTDDWLEKLNQQLSENDVPHNQRPWLAWIEWSNYSGTSIGFDDAAVRKIFAWFEKNTKAGLQYIGPLYTGAFYYDACFWPVFIPVVLGRVQLNLRDSLKTMPDKTVDRLWRSQNELMQFAHFWANCVDYAFGISSIAENDSSPFFARELFQSSDQQLTATVTLLLEKKPNAKAIESARMATEMFLKGFLAFKTGLTDTQARTEIGHDLEAGLNRCLAFEPNSDLKAISGDISIFPTIADRYKGPKRHRLNFGRAIRLHRPVGPP